LNGQLRVVAMCVVAVLGGDSLQASQAAMARGTATAPSVVASIGCDSDDRRRTDLAFSPFDARSLRAAVERCASSRMIHLYYKGEIGKSFRTLIRNTSDLAEELSIPLKVLDIDSVGGEVDEAMQTGDIIGDTDWGIRVAEGRHCLSACVLVLAAGGHRSVSGAVGIHRLFPALPRATTRRQLQAELAAVTERVKTYLRIQGASPILADVMATVPANTIRVLTPDEAREFGLLGMNAADADLNRAHLVRKCGWDFVRRKEAWSIASSTRCQEAEAPDGGAGNSREALQCQADLAKEFGFPDLTCPDESPHAAVKRPGR
jgi:hypothetical protein